MATDPRPHLPDLCTPEEAAWLAAMCAREGYLAPTPMGNGRYAAINNFLYTAGIITGHMGDDWGYADRWCFGHLGVALRALAEWQSRDFEGEPIGWHRHPDSGRRRPDGDETKQYINP